ncbi:hypothetical protein DXG03_004378 [Asterophora parasitica]|uniref:Uncharacterized protein n=1 Tax=Asterophora parasitica TaxID=117018 RepID=A0A9P7KE94_9AGAR|nr:hypothetical protein DXG03_004378 [Asterophora parasitica]
MSSFRLNDCTVQITTKCDQEYQYPHVFTDIFVNASLPGLGSIASMQAVKIHRPARGSHSFHAVMDYRSQELYEFSRHMFDRKGHLSLSLLHYGAERGTGGWGKELNSGEIIHVTNVSVDEQLIEHLMLNKRTSLRAGPCSLVLTSSARSASADLAAQNFLDILAKSCHPSCLIAVSADATDSAEEQRRHLADHPLHSAIVDIEGPEIAEIIKTHYRNDSSSIRGKDGAGMTPIHRALGIANICATLTLLGLGITPDDLRNADNPEGVTPLECLERFMESDPDFSYTMLRHTNGHTEDQLTYEFLVKGVLGMPLITQNRGLY